MSFDNSRNNIQAVIFDLGGVVNSNIHTKVLYPKMLEKYGYIKEKVKDVRNNHWGPFALGRISEEEHWRRIFAELGVEENIGEYMNHAQEILKVEIPRTKKIIRELKKRSVRLAILSNHAIPWIVPTLYVHDLYRHFPVMVISCFVGLLKPDPKIYQLVLEKLEVKPKEAVYIDDQEKNVLPARDLGIQGIKFESARQLEKDLKALRVL